MKLNPTANLNEPLNPNVYDEPKKKRQVRDVCFDLKSKPNELLDALRFFERQDAIGNPKPPFSWGPQAVDQMKVLADFIKEVAAYATFIHVSFCVAVWLRVSFYLCLCLFVYVFMSAPALSLSLSLSLPLSLQLFLSRC
jgi:hypothetical protein